VVTQQYVRLLRALLCPSRVLTARGVDSANRDPSRVSAGVLHWNAQPKFSAIYCMLRPAAQRYLHRPLPIYFTRIYFADSLLAGLQHPAGRAERRSPQQLRTVLERLLHCVFISTSEVAGREALEALSTQDAKEVFVAESQSWQAKA
jgi:hypothetical protein